MDVIAIQMDIAWEDKPANGRRARELIERANPTKGALVVLPEMFACGFTLNAKAAVDGDGAVRANLSAIARDAGIYLIGGVVVPGPSGKPNNCAVAFAPDGSELTSYAKMFPFRLGGEADHYAAGDAIRTFDWHGVTVAPFVCYDLRFPELFRRATLRHGAEIIPVIASWPLPRDQHWITLLRARAIENQAYVIGVNRVGVDPRFTYFGRSLIVDPKGELIADAGAEEGVIRAEVDVGFVRRWREEFPVLKDVRADV